MSRDIKLFIPPEKLYTSPKQISGYDPDNYNKIGHDSPTRYAPSLYSFKISERNELYVVAGLITRQMSTLQGMPYIRQRFSVLNVKKTTVMRISRKGSRKLKIFIEGQRMGQIAQFKYLGSIVSSDGYCEKKI